MCCSIASRALASLLLTLTIGVEPVAGSECRQSLDLRSDWRFAKGDQQGGEAPEHDDSAWKLVRLPHDWAIAGPFNPTDDGATGKLPWRGIGWYRKSFTIDCDSTERVYLDFDGVMAFPTIYVNGKLAGQWDYGYTSFRVDATPYIHRKGLNCVAVRVDTTKHSSRWYPGAGIYRKVSLEIRKPIHISHLSTYVTTPEISEFAAKINVRTELENHTDRDADVTVVFAFRDPNGILQSSTSNLVTIPASGSKAVNISTELPKPQRWDIETPQLYAADTAIVPGSSLRLKDVRDRDAIDRETTTFGIRECQFTADDGFHLNGRRVQLHGVNLHHDQGPLGAAFYPRAMERQLEIMHDMGVNAIRTSHNPPAPELLDLCDRMGILVWDECFDKWNETAARVDGKPSHEEHANRHLRSMVMRDRNHPSVIVWSIGNEIPTDREGVTPERVTMMRDVVRKYDTTRPVGMGCDKPEQANTKILDSLDLTGWNYGRRYARYHERYPDKPIIYSESASALSTRGFYKLPLPTTKTDYSSQHQVDSYDFNAAPWSDIADAEFKLMQDDRFVAGEFVWTGFDYLGEPAPFERQAKSSYFGIVDLCGIPKDRFYLYRSHWRPEVPTVHVVPHWNWPDRVGQSMPVLVYTNGDSAELFLNGKSLGLRRKRTPPERPNNLAAGRPAEASSCATNNPASLASDDSYGTQWVATSDDPSPWWQVDLGQPQPLKCFVVEFGREAKNYGYEILTSVDGTNWEPSVKKNSSDEPRWGGPPTAVHRCESRCRFIRMKFTDFRQSYAPCIREFAAYTVPAESSYYAPTYAYRLRWNDVVYEPGELKATAYKNGQQIGSAAIRTAGGPSALRLTSDRKQLTASGDDLCYILVEAVDDHGTLCPLADNEVHFKVEGAGEIAAVGNGNPLSVEPFQADRRKLFFGKAMLILRTIAGREGDIRVVATSDRLADGKTTCHSAAQVRD